MISKSTTSPRRVFRNRAIPVLLLKNRMLYKTHKFKNPKYVGDPRNAVKIFNDKGVDEIVLLDIGANREKRSPDYNLIEEICSEAFMPLAYGGGISEVEQARRVLDTGVEKLVLCSQAASRPELVTDTANYCGSQSVVVCIDVKKNFFGRQKVVINSGKNYTNLNPISFARQMQEAGAGEIIIQSVDKDGAMDGYDINLIQKIVNAVSVPIIALGGAGSEEDLGAAVKVGGAAAAAAGSLFVFQGPHRAILIQYPKNDKLERVFA